jgi:hypothetical protein
MNSSFTQFPHTAGAARGATVFWQVWWVRP